MISLGLWLTLIARDRRLRVGLKVVQVASAIVAFGTLGWAVLPLRHRGKTPAVIAVVVAAIGIFVYAAHRHRRAEAPAAEAPADDVGGGRDFERSRHRLRVPSRLPI